MKRIIDVTFFDEAINEIGEEVIIFSRKKVSTNEFGEIVNQWLSWNIIASLQPETSSREDFDKGSNISQLWNLYCGSEHRLYIDDLVQTQSGDLLQIYSITPWDNFGVREVKCRSIDASEMRDLAEFEEYREGLKVK